MSAKVYPARVNQIASVKGAWGHPDEVAHVLLFLGQPVEPEPLLKTHATRHEDQQRGSHAERGGIDDGDGELSAPRVELAPNIECEKIEAIDAQIDALEKCVEVFGS